MSRPHRPNQCIGRYQWANDNMREAWAVKPEKLKPVYVMHRDALECREMVFLYFTLGGAALLHKGWQDATIRKRVYINWDKGDMLFTDEMRAKVHIYVNVCCRKTALQRELDEIVALHTKLVAELSNDSREM